MNRSKLGPNRLVPGPLVPLTSGPGRRLGRKVLVRGGLVAVVLTAVVLLHRPVLAGFAGLFRVDDPAPSDALVVLLGGLSHRPAHAAELFARGIAPVVLIGTSAIEGASRRNETEESVRELVQLGVPRSAIVVLPGTVTSTRDEARRVADYAESHALRRITVVTSAFHTARARWIFRKILKGQEIDIRMAAAPHPDFTEASWYKTDEGMVMYFTEAFKTLYYRLVYS